MIGCGASLPVRQIVVRRRGIDDLPVLLESKVWRGRFRDAGHQSGWHRGAGGCGLSLHPISEIRLVVG